MRSICQLERSGGYCMTLLDEMKPAVRRLRDGAGSLQQSAAHTLRQMTSGLRAWPDFVILGAQKAGTTSLYRYLTLHPRVAAAHVKEVHYFDLNLGRGPRWYRSNFAYRSALGHGPTRRLTGEASPYYLFHPHCAERIRATLPEVALIALVRDPVTRALSHYNHNLRNKRETRSFAQALEEEDGLLEGEMRRMQSDPGYESFAVQHYSYKARGRYAEQLERYFEAFGRDRVLVMRSEDLFSDPQRAFELTLAHLGLEPMQLGEFEQRNKGRYRRDEDPVLARLREYFSPHNERLAQMLGQGPLWN